MLFRIPTLIQRKSDSDNKRILYCAHYYYLYYGSYHTIILQGGPGNTIAQYYSVFFIRFFHTELGARMHGFFPENILLNFSVLHVQSEKIIQICCTGTLYRPQLIKAAS